MWLRALAEDSFKWFDPVWIFDYGNGRYIESKSSRATGKQSAVYCLTEKYQVEAYKAGTAWIM